MNTQQFFQRFGSPKELSDMYGEWWGDSRELAKKVALALGDWGNMAKAWQVLWDAVDSLIPEAV
ncbi:MAG: hypothetical protein C5B59_12775 [Bacteroidetes bacterium]|nr:MAG: hypothetical protein C5B59_12775 [Bacteroidota bacterium]